MIFGFNTDVKVGDTVYHVQSEARKKERFLQTQVFVKGRCIGKHATSYTQQQSQPGFSDEQMHTLLKEQHKQIVELVRAGKVESALEMIPTSKAAEAAVSAVAATQAAATGTDLSDFLADVLSEPRPPSAARPVPPPSGSSTPQTASPGRAPSVRVEAVGAATEKGLKLEWIPTDAVFADSNLLLKIQVLTEEGLPVPEAQLTCRLSVGQTHPTYVYATTDTSGSAEIRAIINPADLPECSLLVQASFRGRSASRRLRVHLHG